MSEEKGFWDKQAEGFNNMWRDISKAFTGKDPAVSTFSVYDNNNEKQEQDLSEQGKIYKTPTGYTSHRGYAYLDMGEDGRLKLNVSKSVAESDWFKTQFTENDNFNKIIRMFNGNPGANTTISSTDEDGNVKNITLADAVSQYNKALGEYAERYEGMSALRDFYMGNTGLNLTDEQLMISESSINKDEDKNSDSKVIYIPDSWNAIYNFSKLKSWDPETKTVSAKDFFDVYNLDESGSINEEQWNKLKEAAEAEVTNAFSGSVSHNLNEEDADAVKYAGDKLAKAVAALNTINGSRPDVNFAHGTAIFLSSVGEEFTTVVAKTVGNLGDVAQAFLDACETSEIPVISQVAGAVEGAVDIAATAVTAPIVFIGELAGDLTDGTLSLDHADQYLTNIGNAVGDIWSDNESKKKFSDYRVLAGNSINDLTGALDKDISYMQTISGAATTGKVVGGALGMAFEVWLTEVTGKGAGQLITTSWTALGRGLGLISKTADIAKKVSALTKIYKGVGAVASWGVNMAVQGFMDTIETEPGQFLAQAMRDGNISEEEKQELMAAISSNTMFNIIASGVTEKLIPGFLETKPGRFIQARAQKVASAISLPIKGTEIGLAKLLNNIGAGKKVSESLKEAIDKEVMKFGAYSVNDYYTKLAMADYDATKLVVKAKAGNTYIDSLTENTIKAKTTTEAVEIAVKNRVRLQNMIDHVAKGVDTERKEILADPNVSTTYKDLNKKSTAVAEIESREGRDAFKVSVDGKSTRLMSQASSDYVAYKKNLDYMTRKKDILEAAGKTLNAADEAYLKGLEEKVLGFTNTHSKELVSTLNGYYESNLAFNKALTDYELKNGLITQEMYGSLASTGFFGADDEFYMHTIAIKPKNGKFTEEYAEYEKAMASYEEGYARRSSGTYSINPEHETDQHIAKALDAHYLDPNMADFSRVTAMARTIQARNWGRALSAIGQPFKEISVDGKATSMKQLTDANAGYKQAATKAVDRLDADDLKNVAVGKAYTDQYDIEGRIERKEAAEAKALGIGSNEQMSKNVSNLGSDQIAEDIANIDGAPNYSTISRAEEYDAIYNNMSKEEKLIVDKKMASQTKGYEDAYSKKTKAVEEERKALVKQADGLDKEAAKIDKEIASIEKKNASGQAKYEKAKASAEKKAKAAEEKAKKAATKAKKAGGAEAAEKQLKKDMRDAILYRSGVDIDDGFFPYDIVDVPSMFKESRMDELDEIKIKKGVDLKSLSKTKKMPNPEDIFEKEYIDSVRAKYGGEVAENVASATEVEIPEVKMPEPFVPESTAEKVAEAASKREEAAALRGQVEGIKNPRRLSDKQQTIKAWNDSVKKTNMVEELNKQWLREELLKGEKGAISEEMLTQLKLQIANANYADRAFVKNLETGKLEETKWLEDFRKRSDEIRELKGVLADIAKGEDELMSGALAISDMIVDNTIKDASENMLGKGILERAKAQGIDPDAVQEYMALDALLKQSPDGTMKLRGDVKDAVDNRMRKEFRKNIKAEGNLSEGAEGELIKMLQDTIEEDVLNRWSKAQKTLVDAGGNEFIDMEKNFAFVKKEMENFVGEFNSENVIMMLGEDGVPRYYEVSPLLADLYMNRPVTQFSRVSEFFNKTSRLARLSSTNLNMKSVINQCFKDPINAFIGGGMMRSVRFNQKEMVELFGDNLVAQLEESMTKAGWNAFTEGGTIAGKELQEKAVRYVTEEAGVGTFVEGTSSNVLYDTQRGAFKKVRDGAGAYINMQGYQNAYKRSKKSLLDWANRHSPGYWINETRENYLRKGTYTSAFRDALGQGKTLEEAKNIAEFVSRQATTNFGRMFSWGNSIVNAVPFLGAALNGSTSFWRLYMIDPVGVTMRFTTAGVAMMSIVAQSMTSKRDRDVYKTIPEYVKADNLAFVYDGEVFKIPIPEELAGLLAPFRQAVEKSWDGIENHNWFEILANDLLDVSPIDLDGFKTLGEINLDSDPTIFDRMSREAMVLVSQLSPTILKSAIMGFTGVDPYTGNPIDKSYTTFDEDGNQIIMDSNQTAVGNWLSSTLSKYGIKKSSSFWTKVIETMAGTGFFTLGKAVENALGSGLDAAAQVLAENVAGATTVPSYQLEDPYLREFKATIKQLEDEKNALLAADGDLAAISQQISRLDKSSDNYEEKKNKLMQQWMQKTEDYRKRVLNMVTKYNNHYGSTYTVNQFASVWNLLMFDNQTLIPQDAYQSQQLSQMYYTARQQAYQTMIDMGFDSPNDWSIFGVARRNAQTGEIYIKYSSPTAILNMSSVAMGAGNIYAAELETTLKNAGLDKSTRYKLMTEAQSKGSKAVKEFKKAWNAQVALAIADVMNKYGASNVIESGDATSLLNEYLYVSNSGYKVRDYLEAVYGMED